jgi:hypothetical protein
MVGRPVLITDYLNMGVVSDVEQPGSRRALYARIPRTNFAMCYIASYAFIDGAREAIDTCHSCDYNDV